MADDRLLFDFAGLVTAPGRLARAEASCFFTKNVLFPAPGLVAKRPGFRRQTAVASGTPWKVFSTKDWGSNVLIARGPASGSIGLQFGDGTAAWSALTVPDAKQVRGTPSLRPTGAQSMKRFYITALDAPMRVDSDVALTPVARYAGMPRGLPANRGFALSAAAGTLLPDGYARAYRMTWHRYDAQGVLLSGPPTARWVIRNQAGSANYAAAATKDALFDVAVPAEWGTDGTALTTAYFWRLWGTRTFNAAAPEEGNDEMYLLQERYVTAAEIAAGLVAQITDNTPNDFLQRQLALNTNAIDFPVGELGIKQGIQNADEPPPVAYDVASWGGVTWWADVRYRPQAVLTFLSVGAPNGLQDNDTITVQVGTTPITLRAKLVPALGTDFQLYTGLATTQMNLEATAQAFATVLNFISAINTAAFGNPGVRAYTVGLPASLAGVVYLEASRVDTTGFGLQVVSSRATWFQYDGSGSGSGLGTGYGYEARNVTCFSKPNRADAVPLINRFTAGPQNARILKQQPYGGRLFLFTDQGLYSITGSSFEDFAIKEFALDLKLLAREAVAVCDDAVYAWCTAGIARITDGGWEIVSTPIEPTVQAAITDASFNAPDGQLPSLAFAVADVERHRVLFWYPEREVTTGDVRGCAFALVLDTRTKAWSQYNLEKQYLSTGVVEFRAHGCVRQSDGLVLLTSERDNNPSEGWLYVDRVREAAVSAYFDSYSDGSSAAVKSALTLQYQLPDAGGAMHWQQSVLQLDVDELPHQSSRPLPTQLVITWSTETQSRAQVAAPVVKLVRMEPPREVRRGNSLCVAIESLQGEYFGLVGLQQRYLRGTPFARGKTR